MSLEREVFLLGIWKNFEELEENLTLDELEQLVKAGRDQEHRQQKFMAALQGIDIDEGTQTDEERTIADVAREVEAERTGQSVEYLRMRDDFEGFGVEIVEE